MQGKSVSLSIVLDMSTNGSNSTGLGVASLFIRE